MYSSTVSANATVVQEGIDWNQLIVAPLKALFIDIIHFLPDILVALIILLIGLLVAKIFQWIMTAFLKSIQFDKFADKLGIAALLKSGKDPVEPHRWAGRVVFWVAMFIVIVMILEQLRLRVASTQLDQVFYFLLQAFSALVIFIIGMFMSFIAATIAKTFAQNIGMDKPNFYAGLVKWTILVFTFIACLVHIGLPPQIILVGIAIAYVSICIAFVFAFGFGGTAFAGKLLSKLLKDRD